MPKQSRIRRRIDQLEERCVLATSAELVADIQVTPLDSRPADFVRVGNSVLFSANADGQGFDLWSTDGTTAGTRLVKDLTAAPGDAAWRRPANLRVVGNLLYFSWPIQSGAEWVDMLWRSDGTTAGTNPLVPIGAFETIGNRFVSARGSELWSTDGTAQGTSRIALEPSAAPAALVDIILDPWGTSTSLSPLVRSSNSLYFVRSVRGYSSNQHQLWRTDGTQAGTSMVVDLAATPVGMSVVQSLVDVNGVLYFYTQTSSQLTLWRTNGTTAGTTAVKEFTPGYSSETQAPHQPTLVNVAGTLYFSLKSQEHGIELWRSDGTAAGTQIVKDIWPGQGGSWPILQGAIGSTLYFSAEDPETGREWWKTNGTAAGTQRLFDLYPGTFGSEPKALGIVDNVIYFTADHDTGPRGTWRTDGTLAGTRRIAAGETIAYYTSSDADDIARDQVAKVGVSVILAARDSEGMELWSSSDKGLTAARIANLASSGVGSNPTELMAFGDNVYFTAIDASGASTFTTADTSVGARRLRESWPVSSGLTPKNLVVHQDHVLFYSSAPSSAPALWRTNGTDAGTAPIATVDGNILRLNPLVAGKNVFFSHYTLKTGRELWHTDGTSSGTHLVKEIRGGTTGIEILQPITLGERLLFVTDDGVHGQELWVSDGTASGTYLLVEPRAGQLGSDVIQRFVAGGLAYFTAADSGNALALWRTDGTAQGTRKLLTIPVQPNVDNLEMLYHAEANGTAYFSIEMPAGSAGLWKTDGTVMGTQRVGDSIRSAATAVLGNRLAFLRITDDGNAILSAHVPGQTQSTVVYDFGSALQFGWLATYYGQVLAVKDGKWYFTIRRSNVPEQIWSTDGTVAGTKLLGDLPAGTYSTTATANGNAIYFDVYGMTRGLELWKLDQSGARLVSQLAPAESYASALRVFSVGNGVLVYFNNGSGSRELWRSNGTPAGTAPIVDPVTGQRLRLISQTTTPEINTPVFHAGKLYFGAHVNGQTQVDLWSSDGTANGTWRATTPQAAQNATPTLFPSVSSLYATLPSGGSGSQFMILNASGDLQQAPALLNYSSGEKLSSVAVGNDVYFGGYDQQGNQYCPRLWHLEGSSPDSLAPAALTDCLPWPGPQYLTRIDQRLYYTTEDADYAIWNVGIHNLSDGLAGFGGTFEQVTAAYPPEFIELNGSVFVAGRSSDAEKRWLGEELWRIVPNAEPVLVADVFPQLSPDDEVVRSSQPHGFVKLGNVLLFVARNHLGNELWRTDGTSAGTYRVKDIWPGEQSSNPFGLVRHGSHVYFAADDGAHGVELWKTDGTEAGTSLLRDVIPGVGSAIAQGAFDTASLGDVLYFVADDGVRGREIWQTQGAAANTRVAADVRPGAAGSAPAELTVAGDKLYFVADDGSHGRELWRISSLPDVAGDLNFDGLVNAADVATLLPHLYPQNAAVQFDLTGDGRVSLRDLIALRNRFTTNSADVNRDGRVDRADLAAWLPSFGANVIVGNTTADVNSDGQVSVRDMVLLRNLIPGSQPALAINSGVRSRRATSPVAARQPTDREIAAQPPTDELIAKNRRKLIDIRALDRVLRESLP